MSIKGRIKKQTALNDALIRQALASGMFKVTMEGEVFTRYTTNGVGLLSMEKEGMLWRRCDVGNSDGYRVVNLSVVKNGRRQRKKLRVHRMVWEAFTGNLNANQVINHKDGNKQNNALSNLEQIDWAENTLHALTDLGHSPIRNTVISFEIAEEIRKLNREGIPYSELSKRYNISKGHISGIVNYKIWNTRAQYEMEEDTPIPF